MIQISADKAGLTVRGRERLTTGMSRVVRCSFSFSPAWEGLRRFAEFSDGVEARTVELLSEECDIPHEVLTTAGRVVTVGIHGTNGKDIVLPSVFARLGEVEEGAQGDSDPSLPLTPSLFDQFVVRAEQAHADSLAAQAAREAVETYLSTETSAVMRRNIYRGTYLGSAVTAEQLAAIRDGSFRGFYIGDYWEINGISYRIADMDYWYGVGNPLALTKHHLVLVPDESLYETNMESSNTTENGYLGSRMKKSGLAAALTRINSAFGSANVLSRYDCFVDTAENGRDNHKEWVQTKVDLMNEIMVYGTHIFASMNDGDIGHWNYTSARTQLSLFRLDPARINCGVTYWLRDVVDKIHFAAHHRYGMAYCMKASLAIAVRPVFAIG